jgi:hypothetical protein
MATQDEGTPQAPEKPKERKKVSPTRNVIALALLIAFSTIAYLEWNANRQSGAAINKLNKALENEEGDLLSMQQVNDLVGREPDGPGVDDKGELRVTYTWKGVFRKYPLRTIYTNQSPPKLLRTE